ncbi:MAG: murein biosynthesis integral membrane protein MurJ [Actinomycetota bacterium]|nr:murein biosynthesis integral membrane protein MurJ [Actinomycetota bacterium]
MSTSGNGGDAEFEPETRLLPAVPAALPPVPPPSDPAPPVPPPSEPPPQPAPAVPPSSYERPPAGQQVGPPTGYERPPEQVPPPDDLIPQYPPPVPPPRPLRSWQVEAPESLPGESLTAYVPAPADEREPAAAGGSRLLRATGTMAVATAISRLTGGLKAAVLSAAIGIGLVGDAYTTANNLPNIVYELLIGGVLTSVVVPLLVHAQERDADGGVAYAQRLLSLITVLVVGATALAIVAAPLLTYAYGIRGDSAQVELANSLARILLLEIVFYGIGAVATSILNTRNVFGAPAWAPVLNNVIVIAVGFLFIGIRGTGPLTPDSISTGEVYLLGAGTTLGIAAQAIILIPVLRRVGVPVRFRRDWRGAGLSEVGRLGAWVLGYVAISQVSLIVFSNVANTAAREGGLGSNAYANANLLFQLPYGVLGVALLTALHPRMSRAAAHGDTPALVRDLSLGARLTSLGLIPVAALFMVFGPNVAIVVFAHGQVGVDQARTVGTALALSGIGLVPFALTLLHMRVFYAMKDARTPTLLNLVMVAVRVPAALLVPLLVEPENVVPALGAVNALSFCVGAVVGQSLLRRRFGHVDTWSILRTGAVVSGFAAVGVAAAYIVVSWLIPDADSPLRSLFTIGIGSVVLGIVLVAGLWLVRLPEIRDTVSGLRRRSDDATKQ